MEHPGKNGTVIAKLTGRSFRAKMIDPNTYTASFRAQGDDRTAGMSVASSQGKSADSAHFSKLVDEASGAKESSGTSETKAAGAKEEKHHFSFLDFIKGIIDIINPLQHIPVISTIYRHVTGDEISPMARIVGDTLYGGPIGGAVAVVNVAVEQKTGKDIGETLLAKFTDRAKDKRDEVQLAKADVKNTTRLSDIVWNDTPAAAQDAPATAVANAAPDHGAENTRLAMLALRSDMKQLATARKEFSDTPGPAPTKLSYRTGSSGNAPVTSAEARATSVKAETVPNGIRSSRGIVNVKTALHSQEAPADTAEKRSVPPEQFVNKMMQGLDQYHAMHRSQAQQGTFPAF